MSDMGEKSRNNLIAQPAAQDKVIARFFNYILIC